MSVPDRDDLVAALRAVTGIADAELVHDESGAPGDPGTLRLSLTPGTDEVRVATQVNQLLREQFGLGVDAERVELLEEVVPARHLSAVPSTGPDPTDPLAAAPGTGSQAVELGVRTHGGRLLIQRMQLVSAAPGVAVAVTLAVGDDTVVGESDGPAASGSVHRSVADATLRAVERVAQGRARFDLERVELVPLGDEQVVLVAVSMSSPLGAERLIGTSAVREDIRQAVIRATLDSVNRRLEAVLAG